jgi:hypothetical protein
MLYSTTRRTPFQSVPAISHVPLRRRGRWLVSHRSQVSLDEFCNALRRREAETQQNERLAEEQRLATPLTREQRSQLLRQSVADGNI